MNLRIKLTGLTVFITVLFSSSQFAQDLNEKIKDIEGEVNKITITTEEGEYTFEGNDAVKLFKKLKSHSKSFAWHSTEEDGKKRIVFFN